MVDDDGPPRLILQDFLTAEECKELEFIHKSCCTIGYRSGVLSTTLSHLIATNCSHLILPFVRIRERLKDKVEDFFGCEFELFVEFTGLISWCRGASIGWHSDDNRPYLKQRDFAVVCYLNDYEKDFQGGLFHFQSGEPKTVVPTTGEVVIYTADSRNIHSVDETKPPGFNICWARIHALGFDLYSSGDACSCELLMEPLQLVRGMELCELRFNNILHVLQVVQFYIWKSFGFQSNEVERPKGEAIVSCSKTQQEKIIKLRSIYLDDLQMAETLLKSCFGDMSNRFSFDWTAISKATEAWKWYTNKLQNDLIMSLHYWMSEQSLFFVPIDEL